MKTYRTIFGFNIRSKEEPVVFEKVLSELNSHARNCFWSILFKRLGAYCFNEACLQIGDRSFSCLIADIIELLIQL